jgi:hypothetical protein
LIIYSVSWRVVEIGFWSNAGATTVEPAAYEWNVQHRGGRLVQYGIIAVDVRIKTRHSAEREYLG